MRKVTVTKSKLLTTLKKNKKDHRKDFEEAWDGFIEKATHNFEQRLEVLKSAERGQNINLYVDLEIPEDHSDDYERGIQMLDWEVGSKVELTEQEFQQFVQDDWSWKQHFASAKFAYTGTTTRN